MVHKFYLTYNKEKKMKKLLILFSLLFILGCAKDEDFIMVDPNQEVPEALVIKDLIGIKLENTIVSDRVSMNVKLPEFPVLTESKSDMD